MESDIYEDVESDSISEFISPDEMTLDKEEKDGKKIFHIFMKWVVDSGCCCITCNHRLLVTIISCLGFIGIGPTIGVLSEYLAESESSVSILFTMKSIGMVVGSIILVFVADISSDPEIPFLSISILRLLVICTGLMSIPIFLIPFLPWLFANLTFHFFIGLGIGSYIILGFMIPSLIWTGKLKTMFLHFFNFSFGISAFTYPIFIGVILSYDLSPQNTLIITYIVAGLIGIVPFLLLLCPYINYSKRIKKKEEKKKMIEIEKKNSFQRNISEKEEVEEEKEEENEETATTTEEPKSIQKFFCNPFSYLKAIYVFLASLVLFFYISVEGLFWSCSFLYCVEFGFSESLATLMNTVFFTSFTFGRFCGIFFSQIFSPITIVFVNMTGILGTLSLYTILRNLDTNWVIYLCTLFSGFFCSSTVPALMTVSDDFGFVVSGFENSLMLGAGYCGFTLPTLTVFLMDKYGSSWFLYIGLIGSLGLMGLWYSQFAMGHVISSYLKRQERKKKKIKEQIKGGNGLK